MTKLYLTTCFHGNLGYSSVPEDKYPEIVKKCYWPIISLVDKLKIKLAFEFPAKTLEILEEVDKELLNKIRKLWEEKKIEIIGSGYVQSVFPLIPYEVNKKNLELGNKTYKRLLGKTPEVAFVNESVYSKGLVSLYQEAGYKAIIIDWVNALKSNGKLRECKYFSTNILGGAGEGIKVIWNNFIFFQKLQRYIYGDITRTEYLDFVQSNHSDKENRLMMIYGNDMEIFDFRPRDSKTIHHGRINGSEINRLEDIFRELMNHNDIKFIFPSESLNLTFLDSTYEVGSEDYPLITKKQNKYNIIRWAVCGKDNYLSNSLCYKAYKLLLRKKMCSNEQDWKKLVEFWASDFRTYTEKEKLKNFREELKKFVLDLERDFGYSRVEVDSYKPVLINDNYLETDSIILKLSNKKGGTITGLIFKKIFDEPLILTLPAGYFDEVDYSVDLFSGHSVFFEGDKQKTDLSLVNIEAQETEKKLKVFCRIFIDNNLSIKKTYIVYKDLPKIELEIEFDSPQKISPSFLRTGIITLNPRAFDVESLYYSTKNGGNIKEFYPIKKDIDQSTTTDLRFTAQHCLGTTNEDLEIGDNKKKLLIKTDKSELYSVPLIKFKKLDNSFVLRVFNSVIEKDETSETFFSGKKRIRFIFEAYKTG